MKIWHDNRGRSWALSVNVGTIRRVRELTGKNLLDIAGGSLAEELSTDPVLLADVLCALHRPELEKMGVSEDDFGESLAGDAIAEATDALMEDLVNFFPDQRRRRLLGMALERAKKEEAAKMDKAMEALASGATGDV